MKAPFSPSPRSSGLPGYNGRSPIHVPNIQRKPQETWARIERGLWKALSLSWILTVFTFGVWLVEGESAFSWSWVASAARRPLEVSLGEWAPTETITPTCSPSPIPTPSATNTESSVAVPPEPQPPLPEPTTVPSATPTLTSTATPTETPTQTQTQTQTSTPTVTSTSTPSETVTPTETAAQVEAVTGTATATLVSEATPSPTVSATVTPQETALPDTNCIHTMQFWVDNPQAWPVQELELGGDIYLAEAVLAIFKIPPDESELAHKILQQLLTYKLNVAYGSDATVIEPSVVSALAWIETYPPGAAPGEEALQIGADLLDILLQYNLGLLSPGLCQ